MKKLSLFMTLALVALVFASCNKTDYKSFVGTWGVEKIEYYNIDYAGNPIAATMESYVYNPDDLDNGIQLVFREDKTGEMCVSDIDSVGVNWDAETLSFEYFVYAPDTTLVHTFTYSYDDKESALYMNMKYTYPYVYTRTFMMKVSEVASKSFIYENEYDVDYVERAYLKRLSDTPTKSASRQTVKHPRKPGSLFGER